MQPAQQFLDTGNSGYHGICQYPLFFRGRIRLAHSRAFQALLSFSAAGLDQVFSRSPLGFAEEHCSAGRGNNARVRRTDFVDADISTLPTVGWISNRSYLGAQRSWAFTADGLHDFALYI